MQKRLFMFVLLVFLILFTACSKEESRSDPKDPTSPKEEATTNYYPLTGQKTDGAIDGRIVSVMVNNHQHARPQSGLSKADLVFELLTEGDITRLLALYHSERPEVVGPVRSAREYYFNLAENYGALYVYHGAATFINELILERGIDHLNGAFYDDDGHLFKRESFRQAPHNSYLQFSAVEEVAADQNYDTTLSKKIHMSFLDESETVEGEDVHRIEIGYTGENPSYIVQYIYDEQQEVYERYDHNEQTVELDSMEPIQLDNILIIEADHEVIDQEGRRQIDLSSGGAAYLLQKGKLQEVEWVSKEGQIIPMDQGEALSFVPGKTWINVVPTNPGLHQAIHVDRD